MSASISKRNNSIDSFRLIVAIWVVFGHADAFMDISENLHNLNRYVCQVAVVYMLVVSGYYYILGLLKGRSNFKATLFSILKTYLFWTAVYYALSFFISVIIGGEPLQDFLIQRIVYFFFEGSFYHFWFFPALIYSMLAITLVHRLFGEKGILAFSVFAILINLLCAFGSGYSFIGQNFPVLSEFYSWSGFYSLSLIIAVGFSSYSAGYFAILVKKHDLIKPKTSLIVLAITFFLYMAETLFLVYVMDSVENTKIFFTVYPMGLCMMFAFLNYPMPKWSKLAEYAKKSAGFIYYVHPLILLGLQMVFTYIGWQVSGSLRTMIALLIILPAAFVLIKWDNALSRLLLGIRGSKK